MSSEEADRICSSIVRQRDQICKRCKWKPASEASHFWERHHSATRYVFENLDGTCRGCHQIWEGRRNGYKEYKIKQLGKKGYEALERLHNSVMKRDEAINQFLKLIQ